MNKTLCPECLQMTEYDVIKRPDTFEIRGDTVTVNARVAVCRLCGQEMGLAELDDATYSAAYAVYRARHGLLQPDQIRALRSKYGLGQKAFSRLLGWGEITLARYEQGSLQSASHDQMLRLAEDPAFVRRLLAKNAARLTTAQLEQLNNRLAQLSVGQEQILVREESAPYGTDSGAHKLREMVIFFAEREDMWRTKLGTTLFYADFLHYKRHEVSISGARYVNMQYGPVPASFYTLQASLVEDASLDERASTLGDCIGTFFVANRSADRLVFSATEMQTLEDIIGAFEGWSASGISEYAHQEPAWAQTTLRETIDYRLARSLRLS